MPEALAPTPDIQLGKVMDRLRAIGGEAQELPQREKKKLQTWKKIAALSAPDALQAIAGGATDDEGNAAPEPEAQSADAAPVETTATAPVADDPIHQSDETGQTVATDTTTEGELKSTTEQKLKTASERIGEKLATLKPETIITDDGVSRTVYTFQVNGRKVRALFYPPNELPVSAQHFNGKRLFVIGDKPPWRTDADWESYVR